MTRRVLLVLGLALLAACNKGLQPRPTLQPVAVPSDSTHGARP